MEFLNVLTRNEMKNVTGGGTCDCSYNGCGVAFAQGGSWWSYTVCCDGDCFTENGSGQFPGTLCGGACGPGTAT
ncbi:MAG: hypothetical protein ABJH08_06260 [Balneola sp.]